MQDCLDDGWLINTQHVDGPRSPFLYLFQKGKGKILGLEMDLFHKVRHHFYPLNDVSAILEGLKSTS